MFIRNNTQEYIRRFLTSFRMKQSGMRNLQNNNMLNFYY